MGINTADKETLCKYIGKSKLLIILDKSSKISSLDPLMLNKTLEFFLENTEMPKFIMITDKDDDVTLHCKVSFEVDDLPNIEAARLLLL